MDDDKNQVLKNVWFRSQKMFEKRTFDRLKNEEIFHYEEALRYYQSFFKFCCLKGNVLDIGVGTFLKFVIDKDPSIPIDYDSVKYVGIDPYSPFPEYKKAHFIVGTGEDLPITSSSFDTIIISSTLDHSLSPYQIIKESFRVLRKGGILYLGTTCRDDLKTPQSFTTRQLIEHLFKKNKEIIMLFVKFKLKGRWLHHFSPLTALGVIKMIDNVGYTINRLCPAEYGGPEIYIEAQKI